MTLRAEDIAAYRSPVVNRDDLGRGGDGQQDGVLFIAPDHNTDDLLYPNASASPIGWWSGLPRVLLGARNLFRAISDCGTVHIETASGSSFARQAAPALILGRFLGKRTILSYSDNNAPTRLARAGWWMTPLMRLCDKIVVSTNFLATMLAGHGVTTEVRLPAVDDELFQPREIHSVQPRIIVARSLEARNNIACALEALRLVKQKYPRTEMVVAGDGSLRGQLSDLVAAKGIHGVSFAGRLNLTELAAQLSQVDLYVNASTIDCLPYSLPAALTIGLPVVTTPAGGISEMVVDGVNGLMVRPNDPVGLADRIIRLVESPALVSRLCEQAKLSAAMFHQPRLRDGQ
ncbi:MAG TPA: glycosyltransferase family 4 protein [Candidatus Deferrimicrobium sp.]|nr:glycosyltransferase family 4 protein [Candidatus Deferrimicrobium sp.]